MEAVIFQSESQQQLDKLIALAKQIGIRFKYMSEDEKEDLGLVNAIEQGKTGEYVNTDDFINSLRNGY